MPTPEDSGSTPQLLWRQVLKATIDTLTGRSRGQYDIRLGKPAGIEGFFAGLPRRKTNFGGYTVDVPIGAVTRPIAVPATSISVAYLGSKSRRKDWRIPSQRPTTAYPLWREGTGLLDSTRPEEDFVLLLRDPHGGFHARWLRRDGMPLLPEGLAEQMSIGTAGVETLNAPTWRAVATLLEINTNDDGPRQTREERSGPRVEVVPVEAGEVEGYEVRSSTAVRQARRRERELVRAYEKYLQARGDVVSRNKISVPGGTGNMFSDVFNETRGHLIEAKAGATRNDIRMAIGQLADYARFIPKIQRRAVLLGSKPEADLLSLLDSQGIAVIWRIGDAFEDDAEGAFT
jgi:hypothetical protein